MNKLSFLSIAFLFLFLTACEDDYDDSESDGYAHRDYVLDENYGGGDNYNDFTENPFVDVQEQSVSTFSIDADGASYANVRRFIDQDGQIPPTSAIRTEELINYFDLTYPFVDETHPINLNAEIAQCPWNEAHKLVRIGIKAKDIPKAQLPASNFVFLIDVSGSMGSEDKLALLKSGFNNFVNQITENDKVAIVTYAGSAGVVLPSTSGSEKDIIKNAINQLGSGGSTAGAEGIITAYEIAQENFISNGNNRIIVGTDGDFNVGISNQTDLVNLIKEKRESGIFLTVLGVGRGNLNEGTLEQIANNGNGTFEYIDNIEQLNKVFIYDYKKFFAVAKDVKIQVEFNHEHISQYRLIGYENRVLETVELVGQELQITESGITFPVDLSGLQGTTYLAGNATEITVDNQINARVDNLTIGIDAGNQLQVKDNSIGNAQLKDNISLSNLSVTEDISTGGNITVGEDITIEENLDVAGNTDIAGDLQFGGEFIITRSDFINDNISSTLSNEVIIAVTNTEIERTVVLSSPSLNDDGKIIIIKDEFGTAGTNNITIETDGDETIDGEDFKQITTNYGVLRLYSNGVNWFTF